MRDHTALIERTRHTRITPENARAMRVKARMCQWCGRSALKGQTWCKSHGPGTAADRKRYRRRPSAMKDGTMGRTIITEYAAERMLPAELESWPPIMRILAHRPRHTRPVLLADVMTAFVALAMKNAQPWAALVHRMRDTGIMRDSDKGFAGWHARHHGKRQRQMMTSASHLERFAA